MRRVEKVMTFHHFLSLTRLGRRNRKKLRRLEESDVVLLRYPKSGVTWLRVMITNVYGDRFGDKRPGIVGRSAYHAKHESIPNIFVCMDNIGIPREELEQKLKSKKVILLLRDPRDIAVSLYFHYSKRATKIERIVSHVPDSVEADGPYKFAINRNYGLPQIISFMNYWFGALHRHADGLIVKYEDMRQNPVESFTPAMKMLLPDVESDEVQRAIELSDFEKMKQMEAQGSFGLDILKPGIKDDSNSFKVRRGKVGGFADYLSADEKLVVDKMVAETLAPEIGYS
jgi:hypothetical protein